MCVGVCGELYPYDHSIVASLEGGVSLAYTIQYGHNDQGPCSVSKLKKVKKKFKKKVYKKLYLSTIFLNNYLK